MAFFLAGRFSLMVVMLFSEVTISVSYVTPPPGVAATWAELPSSVSSREPIRLQYCCRASSCQNQSLISRMSLALNTEDGGGSDLRDGAQRLPGVPFGLVHKVQHPWFGGAAGPLSGLDEEEEEEEHELVKS